MKNKFITEIKNKGQVDSRGKWHNGHENVPDAKNLHTCLNCPYPDCKTGTCDLVSPKRRKKK